MLGGDENMIQEKVYTKIWRVTVKIKNKLLPGSGETDFRFVIDSTALAHVLVNSIHCQY